MVKKMVKFSSFFYLSSYHFFATKPPFSLYNNVFVHFRSLFVEKHGRGHIFPGVFDVGFIFFFVFFVFLTFTSLLRPLFVLSSSYFRSFRNFSNFFASSFLTKKLKKPRLQKFPLNTSCALSSIFFFGQESIFFKKKQMHMVFNSISWFLWWILL